MAVQTVIGLRAALWVAVVLLLVPAAAAVAEDAAPARIVKPSVEELATQKPAAAVRETDTREAMCLMIESAAKANDLPLEFFARVIWQESRFQSDAVGPVTRNGQRAQGIAQFMPGTASERRLLDPFDPVQALPKSAEFLSELRNQFGNLGLAAAAYNAGPRRVQEWLAGTGPMPQETRNYVAAITGTTVDDWATAGTKARMPDRAPNAGCRELMALLRRAPNPFVTELEQHVKSCRGEIMGGAACRRLRPQQGTGHVCPRDEGIERCDRRPGSKPAGYGVAQPGQPYFLSGADRRRHPPRRRRSLQPHPPRRRRLFRAAKHECEELIQAGCMTALRRGSLDAARFGQRYAARLELSGCPWPFLLSIHRNGKIPCAHSHGVCGRLHQRF